MLQGSLRDWHLVRNIQQTMKAFTENLFGQPVNIILNWVGNEAILHPYPCTSVMVEPFGFPVHDAVHDIIKIGIVAEQDMTADIPPEIFRVFE